MKYQFQHYIMSSLKLWVENTILSKGQTFNNSSGIFYNIAQQRSDVFTYGLPFKPLVSDASIAGASIMSGVYLDNIFIRPGQSGLVDVNFEQGEVYFSSGITPNRISGNYAINDFNIRLVDRPQEDLLIETKYELKPRLNFNAITGIGVGQLTFPVIYINSFAGSNSPWALGGLDEQNTNIRLIVLGDSQFVTDGICSIFKDKERTLIPLLTGVQEMPFNNNGGYSSGIFNYTGFAAGRTFMTNSIWINEIKTMALYGRAYSELRQLNPDIFPAFVEMTIQVYRNPRI